MRLSPFRLFVLSAALGTSFLTVTAQAAPKADSPKSSAPKSAMNITKSAFGKSEKGVRLEWHCRLPPKDL